MRTFGIVLKATGIVAGLLVVRLILDLLNVHPIGMSPVITAFVAGVIFTIAIIFTGTLADYKESERIPSGLVTSLKSLYKDARIASLDNSELVRQMQGHVLDLVHTMNGCLRENNWDACAIGRTADRVDDDIVRLAREGTAPPVIVKMRSELTNIERLANRIRVIIHTTFIPAAYAIATVATAGVIITLLFVRMDTYWESLSLFGSITLMLVALLLLIRDMDNPFELGKNSHADVDLTIMFDLQKDLEGKR